jgi:hypothetical protein
MPKRAAEAMIRKGTAPAVDYGIKPSDDGRFEIVWKSAKTASTTDEVETVFDFRPPRARGRAHAPREGKRRILHIALPVEFDAQKTESVADPLPHGRRVLADAAGEHQGVQSAQRRGESADPFLGLVAKKSNRFGRPHIMGFAVEEVTHV